MSLSTDIFDIQQKVSNILNDGKALSCSIKVDNKYIILTFFVQNIKLNKFLSLKNKLCEELAEIDYEIVSYGSTRSLCANIKNLTLKKKS